MLIETGRGVYQVWTWCEDGIGNAVASLSLRYGFRFGDSDDPLWFLCWNQDTAHDTGLSGLSISDSCYSRPTYIVT